MSNPKTAIVYASVFASLVPASPQPSLYFALPVTVFAVEASWYAVVATGMSVSRLRGAYERAKTWVDRVAAAVLAALGVRLLATATSRGL